MIKFYKVLRIIAFAGLAAGLILNIVALALSKNLTLITIGALTTVISTVLLLASFVPEIQKVIAKKPVNEDKKDEIK